MCNSVDNQKIASNPELSIWMNANAGTGKTTVLVNRLIRMLLKGIDPSKILCITYTNAAAINIQNRIYNKLKSWIKSDELLEKDLLNIFEKDNKDIKNNFQNLKENAKTLFLNLIDTPTPIKIYTIHSFCQTILKRFPIEAGIIPNFTIIDDIKKKDILRSIENQLFDAENSIHTTDSKKALLYLINNLTEKTFNDLKESIIASRIKFNEAIKTHKNIKFIKQNIIDILFIDYDKEIKENIDNKVFFISKIINFDFVKKYLNSKSALYFSKIVKNLQNWINLETKEERIKCFESLYLYNFLQANYERKNNYEYYNKEFKDEHYLVDEVKQLEKHFKLYSMYQKTIATLNLGLLLNDLYNNKKQEQNLMDFDDLIVKVENLLSKPAIREWILYKLDGGISHILVDESQDTSPQQWDIINNLLESFYTTGKTEKDIKTFFSVGDNKQSIYKFQGANIENTLMFKQEIENNMKQNSFKLHTLSLEKNFRSCKNILNLADKIIQNEKVSGLENVSHQYDETNKNKGYIELTLLEDKKENKETIFDGNFTENTTGNANYMAETLAKQIQKILKNDYINDEKDKTKTKKVQPHDIMILVNQRKYINDLIPVFRKYNIPTLGKDTITLNNNIVIKDLISLLKFSLFPYDNLSLMELLKSPLYNFTDFNLYKLSINIKNKEALFPKLLQIDKNLYKELTNFIDLSVNSTPFAFLKEILNQKQQNIINNYGIGIIEILDSFLNICLNFENKEKGISLLSFYNWFTNNKIKIKRNLEDIKGFVKILTIHGAKGLETPIVFLYNSNQPIPSLKDEILWKDKIPFYKESNLKDLNIETNLIYETNKKQEIDEFYRKLYVAITRAKERLYIIGYGEIKKNSWHDIIYDAMKNLQAVGNNETLILGTKTAKNNIEKERINNSKKDFDNCLLNNINTIKVSEINYQNTSLIIKKDSLINLGTNIHKLLDYITKNNIDIKNRTEIINKFLKKYDLEYSNIKNSIIELCTDPKYNFLFDTNTYNEQETIFKNNKLEYQRIDKLIIKKDNIYIIDYKTTTKIPTVIPEKYKEQLKNYKECIRIIYPNKNIHTLIIWISPELKCQEIN